MLFPQWQILNEVAAGLLSHIDPLVYKSSPIADSLREKEHVPFWHGQRSGHEAAIPLTSTKTHEKQSLLSQEQLIFRYPKPSF